MRDHRAAAIFLVGESVTMSGKTFLDLVATAPVWRVRRAIRRGADVHARDEQDLNALMLAAQTNRHAGTIKALLAAGLDVNTRHTYGWTPLLLACLYGNTPAVVAALIGAGAHVRDTNDEGATPLMLAASMSKPKTVALLLKAGADINARDNGGKTALMHGAPDPRSSGMLALLLKAGADINTRDNEGMTPLLHAAKESRFLEVFIQMLELPRASQAMSEEARSTLIEGTLLHGLKDTRRADRIERLLESGADVNAANAEGETALLLALPGDERSKALEALKRMGFDLETVSGEDGLTFRETVASAGDNLEVVIALLRGGADPNVRNRAGLTPLMRAAHGAWSSGLIERLIEFGADPKVMDPEGKTALEYAVMPEVRSALQLHAGTRLPR